MEKAKNLNQAHAFFLSSRDEGINCIINNKEKYCTCYPEAVEFFNNK